MVLARTGYHIFVQSVGSFGISKTDNRHCHKMIVMRRQGPITNMSGSSKPGILSGWSQVFPSACSPQTHSGASRAVLNTSCSSEMEESPRLHSHT